MQLRRFFIKFGYIKYNTIPPSIYYPVLRKPLEKSYITLKNFCRRMCLCVCMRVCVCILCVMKLVLSPQPKGYFNLDYIK